MHTVTPPTIGRHTDYRYNLSEADHVVVTWSQLTEAVDRAESGDLIFIPGGRTLMTPDGTLTAKNVTIASHGAEIVMTEPRDGDFISAHNSVFAGVNIRGPQTDKTEWPGYGNGRISRGINTDGKCTVRNCRVSGFGHAALTVGRANKASTLVVENCRIDSNPMGGLGYGIATSARLEVRWTYFNNNRHSIAATGDDASEWVIEQCHIGPDSRQHALDTHRPVANRIVCRGCYSELTDHETIRLRGGLREGGVIEDNWFTNESHGNPGSGGCAIRAEPAQSFEEMGLDVRNNRYAKVAPSRAYLEPGRVK